MEKKESVKQIWESFIIGSIIILKGGVSEKSTFYINIWLMR